MDKSDLTVCWSDEDNAFIATCTAYPWLSTFGDTEEQAIHEARIVLQLIEAELVAPRMHPRVEDAVETIQRRYQGMTKDELLAHARTHHGTDLEKLMRGLTLHLSNTETSAEEKKEKNMTEKISWQWMETPSDFKINPFITLPLHRRRDMCVALGNKIRQGVHKFGGAFHAPEAPEGSWADFFFLGQAKGILWNASAITLQAATERATEEVARDMAMQVLPEDVRDSAFWDHIGHAMGAKNELARLEFGGKTLTEFLAETKANILANNPPQTGEVVGVEIEYCGGIGLEMVLDVPEMSVAAVEDGIRRFREIEQDVLAAVMEKVAR
jgi:predicted RNase H-like HicB family nuclease